jgi:hypothetical protein
MTEELPPLWALDKAAKAAGWNCWEVVPPADCFSGEKRSIIAHARTIAQYEQPPVDEDELALARIMNAAWGGTDHDLDYYRTVKNGSWPAALAQFKRELEGWK